MASGPDLIGPVFGLLCRLTADRRQAEWLTARVLASSVSPSQALDEARRLYLLDSLTNTSGPRGDDPVSAMTPESRVADERNPDSPNASLWRSRDLWLDDDTRHRIRDLATTVPASAGGEGGGGLPAAPLMSPRRKRTLIVSAGLTVAVLAAMVASSAIGSDSDALGEDGFTPTSATTESSESPDTTDDTDDTDDTETTEATDDTSGTVPFTVVVETTVSEPLGPPGFILDDDPDGLRFAGAWENDDPGFSGGWLQLWASPDADRNVGRWAVIANTHAETGFFCCDVRLDGFRVDIGGAPALVSTSPDGVMDVVTVTTDDEQVNVRSYGLTMDEIARLILGISADGVEPVLGADALAVLEGSAQVMSRSGGWGYVDGALWDTGASRGSSYMSTDSFERGVWIDTKTATSTSLQLSRLLRPRPTLGAAPGGWTTIAGRNVLVTIDPPYNGQPTSYQLQFIEGEDLVSVGGQVEFGALIPIVADLHRATAQQWKRTLAREPEPVEAVSTAPTPMQPRYAAAGTTAIDDVRWGVEVSTAPRSVQVSYNSDRFSGGGPIAQLNIDERPVQYLAALDGSLVVVVLADVGPGSSILFTPQGATSTLVPLREMSDETYSAASFAYATYGPCLVQLVDASGTITAELTSS